MNSNDREIFKKTKPKLIEFDEKKNLHYGGDEDYYGFGWSHNFNKPGIWSEGPISTLFFRTNENYEDLKLVIVCKPYITRKNNILKFDVYVNDLLNKNVELTKNNKDEKFEVLIKGELISDREIKIDFKFKNPVSPYEVLESPDARKLGILLKNITISSI